jgi:hypothetical protein
VPFIFMCVLFVLVSVCAIFLLLVVVSLCAGYYN